MQWNRLAWACTAISLWWTPASGQTPGTEYSAKSFVEMALQRNREYQAAKAKITEADALLRQAGIRPTPSLEIEAASGQLLGSSGESTYSAAYFQTIERGGKRDKRIEVAAKAKAVAEAEADEQRRQLTFEVKTRFYRAVTEELKLSAINRLIPINRENYQMTVSRVELGDAAPLEEQLLSTDVNRTEAQQAIFSARSDAALLELKSTAGLADTDSIRIPADFMLETPAQTLSELTAYALNNRPDLHILAALEEQNSAEAEQARSEGKPDLTASARYSRVNSKFDQFGFSETGAIVPIQDHDNIATFGVAIPLFTKKRTEGAVSAALARKTQAQLRREYLLQSIPQEVEAAFRRWSGAQRTLQILKTGVLEQSQKNLIVIREAYRLGQLRLFDVLNEQRKLVETELAFVDAQSDAAQALADLEKAVGGNLP
jgi:outer membrane protein TolC